jgi:hypothetical protein
MGSDWIWGDRMRKYKPIYHGIKKCEMVEEISLVGENQLVYNNTFKFSCCTFSE